MLGKKGQNQFTKGTWETWPEEIRQKFSAAGKRRRHSPETREKISLSLRKFIQDNPSRAGYAVNHYSKGPSYPEIYWKTCLENAGLVFEEQFPLGTYRLDFAFPDVRVDLEIDGEQHYLDPRLVGHDQRRTEKLKACGWRVVRVRWSEFQKLQGEERTTFVTELLGSLAQLGEQRTFENGSPQ